MSNGIDQGRIIDTALALLEADGEAALGFNRVARELGIKPPSLYNHVASGEQLRQLVAIRGWQRFGAAARKAAGTRTGGQALHALAHAYRAFAHRHLGLFRLMGAVSLSPSDGAFHETWRSLMQLFLRPLGELGVPAGDQVHHARALRAGVHGFVVLEQNQQFEMSEDIDDSFERLVGTIIRGIESQARPRRRGKGGQS